MLLPPPKLISFTPTEKSADRPVKTAKHTFLKVSLMGHNSGSVYFQLSSNGRGWCGLEYATGFTQMYIRFMHRKNAMNK
jgi:hypothetical protein